MASFSLRLPPPQAVLRSRLLGQRPPAQRNGRGPAFLNLDGSIDAPGEQMEGVTTLDTYGHLLASVDEELSWRREDLVCESGVARWSRERAEAWFAMAGRARKRPLTRAFSVGAHRWSSDVAPVSLPTEGGTRSSAQQ
jgi:hypothetical protein